MVVIRRETGAFTDFSFSRRLILTRGYDTWLLRGRGEMSAMPRNHRKVLLICSQTQGTNCHFRLIVVKNPKLRNDVQFVLCFRQMSDHLPQVKRPWTNLRVRCRTRASISFVICAYLFLLRYEIRVVSTADKKSSAMLSRLILSRTIVNDA